MTDESPGPNLVNDGLLRSAAIWETLCPVAKETRNTARRSESVVEGLCWNLVDCNRSRTFLRDQLGGLGIGGGRCLKNEAFRRSHSLSSILTPKPNETGSLMATMALVTVAGDTLWLEWNKEVAKLARTCGVMTVTFFSVTKVWNFFHPDSYCLRVEVL